MDSATEDLYLQKIEEFVHDEEKIVTFKWLSTTLDINVNDSKVLLEKYVTDHRETKPNELGVTYVITGVHEDDTSSIAVVKEGELDDNTVSFKKLLNKQIYSVERNKDVDINTIGMVDYFDKQNPRETPIVGSMISKNCIKRAFKPRKALPPPPPPVIKGKSSPFVKEPPKSSEKVTPKDNEQVNLVSSSTNQNKKPTISAKPKQNSGGIAGFFNKATVKNDTKPKVQQIPEVKVEVKEEKKPIPMEIGTVTTRDRINKLVDSDSDTETPSTQSGTNKVITKPKSSKKRPRKDNKKNDSTPKRRKRIVEHKDSDSDDIFGNDEVNESVQEDVIDASYEEPVLKPVTQLGPKNKRRKFVDRTYTDDDGYVITKKEWVEESPSEDEAEQENKIQNAISETDVVEEKNKIEITKPVMSESNLTTNKSSVNGKSNSKANNKGKKAAVANQPTLMNFFKKK